jgi:DNA-binding LacI/PurR family transcriptional regulator
MATIKDIAARSQVSTATVSHVINHTSDVSPERRERVLRVIRELKYHLNAVARSLRTKQTRTVGMIIPDITNPFFPAVVRGAEDVLQQASYTLIVGNSDSDSEKEEAYYRTFSAKRVDGLLLVAAISTRPPEYISATTICGLLPLFLCTVSTVACEQTRYSPIMWVDDLEWFELAHPSVSAVVQNAYRLGAGAAQILAKRLRGELTGPARKKTLKTRLMMRESSGAPGSRT